MRDLLLRRSFRPPALPARSQVGARLSLADSDRCSPRFTASSGTQRARLQSCLRSPLVVVLVEGWFPGVPGCTAGVFGGLQFVGAVAVERNYHLGAVRECKDQAAVEEFIHPDKLPPGQVGEAIGVPGLMMSGPVFGVLDVGSRVDIEGAVGPVELGPASKELDRIEALADEAGKGTGFVVSPRRVQIADGQVRE